MQPAQASEKPDQPNVLNFSCRLALVEHIAQVLQPTSDPENSEVKMHRKPRKTFVRCITCMLHKISHEACVS